MKRTLAEWLSFAESVHPRSIEMGLDRVRAAGESIGLLPWRIPSIIVAGTNGKGSVTCAAERILLAHGLPAGAGYSPHLHRFNERIHINGNEAADSLLIAGFEAVERGRAGIPLTYFELSTLVSLWAWRETGMACTVLEVGLGGRLDAFNVVDAQVAVVTSIGLDHQEYLGTTRELIGAEKAGVFRSRQRVVLGRNMPDSVRERATALGCEVVESGTHVQVEDRADAVFMRCSKSPAWSLEAVTGQVLPTVLAPHNVALAIVAAAGVIALDAESVRDAVATAGLPGRTEHIAQHERLFVLDIAHNPDGAAFLADRLTGLGLSPEVAILGTLKDKDTVAIARQMTAHVPRWIAVATEGPRGQGARSTLEALQAAGAPAVSASDLVSAIELAVQQTTKDGVILIFGSFSVVGAARAALGASRAST